MIVRGMRGGSMAKNDDSSNKGKGIGFTGLLQIVFITLKLLNKITWSWVWVLAPAWIYASVIILLAVGYVVVSVWKDKQ